MSGKRLLAVVAAATAAEMGLIHLGRTYGSTTAERRASLPGDDIIPDARVQTDHAVTIDAPPSAVWPWVVQMGWGRAGWYTARWVDRLLFPANGRSADRIVAELQDIDVGTFIPDGPPETKCGFHVVAIEPERALVLRSTSHRFRDVPRPPARHRRAPRSVAGIDRRAAALPAAGVGSRCSALRHFRSSIIVRNVGLGNRVAPGDLAVLARPRRRARRVMRRASNTR